MELQIKTSKGTLTIYLSRIKKRTVKICRKILKGSIYIMGAMGASIVIASLMDFLYTL